MIVDRLSGLAMIVIEHKLTERLNEIDIVKDFAVAKTRKINFQ